MSLPCRVVFGDSHDVVEVDRRLDAGESAVKIADDLGVTTRTLRNRLHAAGLPLPQERRRRQRQARLDDQEWLRDRYVVDGWTPWSIAAASDASTVEVRAALQRFGVERPVVDRGLTRAELVAAFERGESVKSIARSIGMDRTTVRRAMRKHGITNPRTAQVRPSLLDDPVWLRSRYIDDRAPMSTMANEVDAHTRTVRAALVRHGIPIRSDQRLLDPETARLRVVVGKKSVEQIAAEFKVSQGTVWRVLREQGVPIPPRPRQRWLEHNGQYGVAWLRRQVVVRHRTTAAIAAEAGVSPATIGAAIREHNIRRGPRRRGEVGLGDAEWLRTRYITDGATAADIAAELGVRTSWVRSALARFSITRSP